jgi:hypothetical protein
MNDIECPYCGAGQDICHDDGFGYEEDLRHEQECGSCGKTFVFTTSISFYYEAAKADCLNGEPHKLKMSMTMPRQYSEMCCEDCDYRRKPTPAEFSAAGIEMPGFKEPEGKPAKGKEK